ncbi:MAG: adenylyl cyclase, partial [Candidatus Promineifilaceae bacterium]
MSKVKTISITVMVVLMLALMLSANALAAPKPPAGPPDFGPNVLIFDPSMPLSQIQAKVDAIADQQVDDEMGTNRYALLFKPGTYGTPDTPLIIQVGYYTEVAGLGASPEDVVINGHVDVYNRCLTADNCIALVNFWRSLSNLT